jgi:hypothetical protein
MTYEMQNEPGKGRCERCGLFLDTVESAFDSRQTGERICERCAWMEHVKTGQAPIGKKVASACADPTHLCYGFVFEDEHPPLTDCVKRGDEAELLEVFRAQVHQDWDVRALIEMKRAIRDKAEEGNDPLWQQKLEVIDQELAGRGVFVG